MRCVPGQEQGVLEWVNSMCQVGPEHARRTTIQKMQTCSWNRIIPLQIFHIDILDNLD